jgi:hypothetical protein
MALACLPSSRAVRQLVFSRCGRVAASDTTIDLDKERPLLRLASRPKCGADVEGTYWFRAAASRRQPDRTPLTA